MKLLLVCLGNICRSPMAEGALHARLQASPFAGRVQVDSAGTGDWHVGEPPDRRAIACARGFGVDIGAQRARQLQAQDFHDFDWLLCADRANVRDARQRAPAGMGDKVVLLLDWSGVMPDGELPDPYTGGPEDFRQVWRLVDSAAQAVVARLATR